MITNKEDFPDYIAFIDEDGNKKEWFVKIIEDKGYLIKFKTVGGNFHSIPPESVKKIKQRQPQ